jgi:hypothetical protein
MSIDLWSQFVDYLSDPSIGGFVRWIVPAFSGVLLIVKRIQVILDNLDSNRLFGLRYKIRAHKYLSLIDNVEGLDDDSRKSANSLKNALFDDVKVDMIQAYLNERYKRRIDRFTAELLVYTVAWLIVASLFTFAEHLLKLSEGEAIVLSDVKTQYALMIMACSFITMLIILGYIVIKFSSWCLRVLCAFILLSRKKMRELSLSAILLNLNPGQQYLFIDASVYSGIPSSPIIGNSNNVAILTYTEEQKAQNISRSEFWQCFGKDADKMVTDLVMNFLWEKELFGKDVVYFVYSRYGLSAIQVASVLRTRGFAAHYIGKSDGRSKELARAIKEIELLRACGLK